MVTARFSETLASTNHSARRLNLKEHNQDIPQSIFKPLPILRDNLTPLLQQVFLHYRKLFTCYEGRVRSKKRSWDVGRSTGVGHCVVPRLALLIAGIFTMVSPDNASSRRRKSVVDTSRPLDGLQGHTAKHCQVRQSPIEHPLVQAVWHDTDRVVDTSPHSLAATTRNVETRTELGHFGKVSRSKLLIGKWDSILLPSAIWKRKKKCVCVCVCMCVCVRIILRVVSYELNSVFSL
jgi:hypothetical protein